MNRRHLGQSLGGDPEYRHDAHRRRCASRRLVPRRRPAASGRLPDRASAQSPGGRPLSAARRGARPRRADPAATRRALARSPPDRAFRSPSIRLSDTSRLHRMCPTLFERRIVEEGVWPRVQDLVTRTTDGSGVSREMQRRRAVVHAREDARSGPARSIASSRQSRTVWLTSG